MLHIAHSGGALITYLAAQHHLTRRYAFASGWSPLLSALTTTSPTLGLKQPRPRSANILALSVAVSLNPDEPCLIPVHWTVDNGARVFTSFLLYSKQPARWHCPNIFLLCLFLPVNCPPETFRQRDKIDVLTFGGARSITRKYFSGRVGELPLLRV